MKWAVDRFQWGSENEVQAIDFYGQYIPRKDRRFFCPECSESVYWRSRGGKQPDKFCHYKRKVSSPECNRRVDGRSNQYLYQRVGLSLYLSHEYSSTFCMNIAFPALGDKSIEKAEEYSATVTVSSGINTRKVPISFINFSPRDTTYVPIDFVSDVGENYHVKIDSKKYIGSLHTKWSDYADGFSSEGAIFAYADGGGKKIRRGDSITINKNYYFVGKSLSSFHSELVLEAIGSVYINRYNYTVYLGRISINPKNKCSFAKLGNYMKSKFGVWLLETDPELIALWPPVVESDGMIPIIPTKGVYCSIKSGNEIPRLYAYTGIESIEQEIIKMNDSVFHAFIRFESYELFLSVDRKYIGRELRFHKGAVPNPGIGYSFEIISNNNEYIPFEKITQEVLSSEFFMVSNSKFELYAGSRNGTFRHISIREDKTIIPKASNTDKLIFVVENTLLLELDARQHNNTSSNFNENIVLRDIIKHRQSQLSPLPRWISPLLLLLRENDPLIFSYVISFINKGKIPFGILKTLEKLKGDIVNG